MILIIVLSLCILVPILIGIGAGLDEGAGVGIGAWFFTTLFASLFFGLACVLTTVWAPKEWHEKGTWELVALGSDSQTEGFFFLGSGYIDSKPVYSFVNKQDGYYNRGVFDAADSRVYIDNNPHLTQLDYRITNKWFSPWALTYTTRSDFYVPEGSIYEGYEVKP